MLMYIKQELAKYYKLSESHPVTLLGLSHEQYEHAKDL